MAARDASPTSTSSTLSNITVQTEKQVDARIMSSASPSISTPPTSLDDECSVLSDTTKAEQSSEVTEGNHVPRGLENAPDTPGAPQDVPPSDGRRSARSSRKSVATYNVQILAGTAIHTPTKYLEKHHKNVLHGSIDSPTDEKDDSTPAKKRVTKAKLASANVEDPVEQQLVSEAAQAARRRTSSRVTDLRKEALRNISGVGNVVANALSDGKALVQNTLKRSASDPALQSSKLKRTMHMKGDDVGSDADGASDQQPQKSKTKLWLRQGLYVGQHRDFNPRLSETQNRARKRAKKRQDGEALPLPMFAADRVLNEDPHHVFKDFKLPFDTYHPLPRKVKVDGWVKLSKSTISLFLSGTCC
jgi:palmitoyltransferase ZDHHC9/14/18